MRRRQPGKWDVLRLHRPENWHAVSDSENRHVRQSCETFPGWQRGPLPLVAELLKLLRREATVGLRRR